MSVTKFAQHGLVRLGYEVNGEGEPPVLVLHGLLQGRITMRPLTDALEDNGTVVSMDLRGHGGSSVMHGLDLRIADLADDAFAVLDSAGIDTPVTVVGVELGAVIAAVMAETRPNRVGNTILINYPAGEMLDADILKNIADTAYKGQADQALTRWLDLSWGTGWKNAVAKPRIGAARRSVEAIHPMLNALAKENVAEQDSISLPGGAPFDKDDDLARILATIADSANTN